MSRRSRTCVSLHLGRTKRAMFLIRALRKPAIVQKWHNLCTADNALLGLQRVTSGTSTSMWLGSACMEAPVATAWRGVHARLRQRLPASCRVGYGDG